MIRTWPDDDHPEPEPRPEAGQVEHTDDCPGGRLVRRQSARHDLLVCTACYGMARTPRRTDWTDPTPERTEK